MPLISKVFARIAAYAADMSLKRITKKWMETAISDHKSALYLFDGAHYPQAIYYLCQSLEKILKAVQIELTNDKPKKIHKLENIAKKTTLHFSEKQYNELVDLSKHYSKVRYPDLAQDQYNTKKKVLLIMRVGKKLFIWIQAEFKNH